MCVEPRGQNFVVTDRAALEAFLVEEGYTKITLDTPQSFTSYVIRSEPRRHVQLRDDGSVIAYDMRSYALLRELAEKDADDFELSSFWTFKTKEYRASVVVLVREVSVEVSPHEA
jgi:hypothetical protein